MTRNAELGVTVWRQFDVDAVTGCASTGVLITHEPRAAFARRDVAWSAARVSSCAISTLNNAD